MLLMHLGERTDSVGGEEFILVQHITQYVQQLVPGEERSQEALAEAGFVDAAHR